MVTRVVELASHLQGGGDGVEILILGAGWTGTFLIPLLQSEAVSFAATTTTGRDDSIKFKFDPESTDEAPYKALPQAKTVLIVFPLTGKGQSKLLTDMYAKTHSSAPRWIQLGSTGAFVDKHWNTHKSPVNTENDRVTAEAELLSLGPNAILHLAGLYGGNGVRDPKTWVGRVIKTKADLKGKKALHLVNGKDVARAILGAHREWDAVQGQRWIVNDLHVYDWWDLIFEWNPTMELEGETVVLQRAVFDCMLETGVRALPRSPEDLGRVLDGTEFWKAIKNHPAVGRVR